MTNQTVISNKSFNIFLVLKTVFAKKTIKDKVCFEKLTSDSLFIYSYALLNANSYKDMKTGGRYLKKAARKNHQDSLLLLARNYYYGYGVKKSDKKAYETWGKGAKKGNAECAYYYGLCYAKGIHTAVNIKMAEKYFNIALNKGFSIAKIAMSDFKYAQNF